MKKKRRRYPARLYRLPSGWYFLQARHIKSFDRFVIRTSSIFRNKTKTGWAFGRSIKKEILFYASRFYKVEDHTVYEKTRKY